MFLSLKKELKEVPNWKFILLFFLFVIIIIETKLIPRYWYLPPLSVYLKKPSLFIIEELSYLSLYIILCLIVSKRLFLNLIKTRIKIKPVLSGVTITLELAIIILFGIITYLAIAPPSKIFSEIVEFFAYPKAPDFYQRLPFWVKETNAIIIAPIKEEIIFRYLLFLPLVRWLGFVPALIINSFAFTLLHQNFLMRFLVFFLSGIIFSTILYRHKSLLMAILTHSIINLIPALLNLIRNFLKFLNITSSDPAFEIIKILRKIVFEPPVPPVFFLIIFLILSGGFSFHFYKFLKTKPDN